MSFEQVPLAERIKVGDERKKNATSMEKTKLRKSASGEPTRELSLEELKVQKERLKKMRKEKSASVIGVEETAVPEYNEEIEESELSEASPEEKERLALDRLAGILQQVSGEKKSEKQKSDIINDKTIDMPTKIKKMLNLYQADKLEDISDRETVFTYILNIFKPLVNAATVKVFDENRQGILMAPNEKERDRKREELADKIHDIEKKYDTNEIFDYLKLGIEKGGSFEMG